MLARAEQKLAEVVVRARKVRLCFDREAVEMLRLRQIAAHRRRDEAHPIQRSRAARVEAERLSELRLCVRRRTAALQQLCCLLAQRVRLARRGVPKW